MKMIAAVAMAALVLFDQSLAAGSDQKFMASSLGTGEANRKFKLLFSRVATVSPVGQSGQSIFI